MLSLLEVGVPVLNGIEAAKRIKQTSPASKIIFLTQDMDVELRIAALATGAEAYVLKARAVCHLQPAVKAALRNGSQAHAPNSRPFAHISR
jgi:DNA-binding response OmpR family regulator